MASGEVLWRGLAPLGPSDGRIAFYLPDRYALLAPPSGSAEGKLATEIRRLLETRGALFFSDLATETGAFAGDIVNSLWELVWSGQARNDTLAPLRSLLAGSSSRATRRGGRTFRSRRLGPPGSEGRWSLTPVAPRQAPTETERRAALARILLERYGVLIREAAGAEGIEGGFSSVYPVLKAMEEAGQIRRGYFVAGLGATQFALAGAEDRLRSLREPSEEPQTLVLAATDPANPYGASLPWPAGDARPQRAAGAHVVLRDGALLAWIGRTERNLVTYLPPDEPERGAASKDLARTLARLVESGKRRAVLVGKIDGRDPRETSLSAQLVEEGFLWGSRGYLKRPSAAPRPET
jgi:ATP-dependent Lhr-like helicase